MKQKMIIIALGMCFCISAVAQSLSGKIQDKEKASLAYVTVSAKSQSDTTQIYGGISDDNGKYRIQLPMGNYKVEYRFLGYKSQERVVSVKGDAVLPDVVMEEDIHQMKEVNVIANRITRKPDRFEINMQNSSLSKGKNIEQVLTYLPGVSTVGGVSINGRSGTLVYIDNRKVTNPLELTTLRAENIKSVEIIPMAGSEYGTEATGGVLKITMKKQESGFTGTVLNYLRMYDHGFKSEAPGFIANYRYKKLGVYNMFVIGGGKYYMTDETRNVSYPNGASLEENNYAKKTSTELVNNLTLRYDISKRQDIALHFGISLRNDSLKRYSMGEIRNEGGQVHHTNMEGKGKSKIEDLNLSLLYNWKLNNKGSKLTLDANYQNNLDKQNNLYSYLDDEEDLGLDIRSDAYKSRVNHFSANPKLQLVLGKKAAIMLGGMAAYTDNKNDVLQNSTSEDYRLKGMDHAVFADFRTYLTSKFYLNLGLRYQTDKLEYENPNKAELDFTKNFDGLYPTMNLAYTFNKKKGRMLSLGYRYYQSFPNFGYFFDVKEVQSDNSYSIGNSNLNPEHFHLAELTYTYNKAINFIYSYRRGTDLVQVMTFTEEDNPLVSYTKPENIGENHLHRFSVEIRHNPLPWWFFKFTARANYEDRTYGDFHFNQWYGQASLNNNFTFKNGWGGTLGMSASTKRRNGDYTFSWGHAEEFSIYKSLLKNKLNISAGITNFAYKRENVFTEMTDGTTIRSIGHEPVREYSLTLTYSFQSGKKIKNVKALNGAKLNITKATRD